MILAVGASGATQDAIISITSGALIGIIYLAFAVTRLAERISRIEGELKRMNGGRE